MPVDRFIFIILLTMVAGALTIAGGSVLFGTESSPSVFGMTLVSLTAVSIALVLRKILGRKDHQNMDK